MPQTFILLEGDAKLLWEGATRNLVRVQYGTCEFVNLDLESGV